MGASENGRKAGEDVHFYARESQSSEKGLESELNEFQFFKCSWQK